MQIVEVGPRDGLQNEAAIISADNKITLIGLLAAAELTAIESGSFVPPRWVPQMANSDQALRGIDQGYVSCFLGCSYEGTVPTQAVVRTNRALFAMECHEAFPGDTIGIGTPTAARG